MHETHIRSWATKVRFDVRYRTDWERGPTSVTHQSPCCLPEWYLTPLRHSSFICMELTQWRIIRRQQTILCTPVTLVKKHGTKGRQGRACLYAWQMGYAVPLKWQKDTPVIVDLRQRFPRVSRMISIYVKAELSGLKGAGRLCVSGWLFWSEQTDSSQVGYWPDLISYQLTFLCRCVIKVSDGP